MKTAFDWALPALSIVCIAVIIGLPLLWRPPRATAPARPDKLDALMHEHRDLPHELHGWGPDADKPVPYLPAEVDDFERWAAELEDQR